MLSPSRSRLEGGAETSPPRIPESRDGEITDDPAVDGTGCSLGTESRDDSLDESVSPDDVQAPSVNTIATTAASLTWP